jgi:hypothetical protein
VETQAAAETTPREANQGGPACCFIRSELAVIHCPARAVTLIDIETCVARRLKSRALTVTLAALCVLPPALLHGHHDFRTEFDIKQRVTLHGRITKIDWINPHTWFHLQTTDDRPTEWAVEGASPQSLLRRGWRKDSLRPGMLVTIEGFRARSGKPIANGRDVTLPDGHTLCANIPCRCCSELPDPGR